MTESMVFGPLSVRFDAHVLRPRPWTLAQAAWAAELAPSLPAGPILELCAGVGHIGLAAAALTNRDVVLVDIDPHACALARTNAEAAQLPVGVDVRTGPVDTALAPDERFPLVLVDPPWVRRPDVSRFPDDPLTAIDGGIDGLDVARTCLGVVTQQLASGGIALLQLGDERQVADLCVFLDEESGLDLHAGEVRQFAPDGVLVCLSRRP